MTRRLQLQIDDEFACLLTLYTRTGESPRMALLKSLRLWPRRNPDGKPKAHLRTRPGMQS